MISPKLDQNFIGFKQQLHHPLQPRRQALAQHLTEHHPHRHLWPNRSRPVHHPLHLLPHHHLLHLVDWLSPNPLSRK